MSGAVDVNAILDRAGAHPDAVEGSQEQELAQVGAVVDELRGLLRVTLMYLDHPDVVAVPFTVSAATQSRRIRAALARVGGAK